MEGEDGEGVELELERQVGVRREVYAKGMFAKVSGGGVEVGGVSGESLRLIMSCWELVAFGE